MTTVDEDLNQLEKDIRQLKVEYDADKATLDAVVASFQRT